VNEGLVVDVSGNTYSTGYYGGTVDFDPGIGTSFMTSNGGLDIYVCMLNASGSLVWARSMGGNMNDLGLQVARDNTGNVFITGYFSGTADFDPGVGIYNLTSQGSDDIFICKLDPVGNFLWAKSMGGTYQDWGFYCATDVAGNVYTTGFFQGTVDFDPGSGTYNLSSGSGSGAFINKLDANGNFVWAGAFSGNAAGAKGNSISLDASGDVYSTGYFSGTVDFDPGTGTDNHASAGGNDAYISRLDANGNFIWAKQLGGSGGDQGFSISVDGAGNVYSSGYFTGTADLDPGPGVFNLAAANTVQDAYISKLDGAGNFVWAKQLACANQQGANINALSLTAAQAGNIFISGDFYGTVDLDPGSGAFNVTSLGTYRLDVFMMDLDASGNFYWGVQLGDTLDDASFGVGTDPVGNLYLGGYFGSTVDFDPGSGVTNLSSAGYHDAFVCKYSNVLSVRENEQHEIRLSAFPNPFSGTITLIYSGEYEKADLKLMNELGEKVMSGKFFKGMNSLPTDDVPPGIYFLQVTDAGGSSTVKIIKQ
jgi:hypothetical protein